MRRVSSWPRSEIALKPSKSACVKPSGLPSEFLYGVHPVREALRARRRRFFRLLIAREERRPELDSILELAEHAGVRIERIVKAKLHELVGDEARAQGVVLEASPLPTVELNSLVRACASPRRFIALDGVEDPQNVGAVIRVAEAAGFQGLLMTERNAPPLGPAIGRASAGASEHLPIARVVNLASTIDRLKEDGFWMIGADQLASRTLFELDSRAVLGDLLVVLGAEDRGLREGVRKRIDYLVSIPMVGAVESLNVSCAAAIVLFELRRQALASCGENRT